MSSKLDINQLLDQTTDVDPDIRYMALSDIDKVLSSQQAVFANNPYKLESISKVLVLSLSDNNPDVQNQAVKNFKSFGAVLNESNISLIDNVLKSLFSLVQKDQQKKSNDIAMTSSIFTMALRYFLQNLKATNKKYNLSQLVVSIIFPSIVDPSILVIPSLDYIELLFDLIKFNGRALNDSQINDAIALLINSSYKSYGVLSSKSVNTLALLIDFLSLSQMEKIINNSFLDYERIQSNNPSLNKFQIENIRLNILLNLTKTRGDKFATQFKAIFQVLKENLFLEKLQTDDDVDMDNDDDSKTDELRDLSLSCMGNLVSLLNPYINDVIGFTKSFLTYDPYTIDDGEEIEDDLEFSDDEFYDDDGDDNDDFSWRLRKQSAKILGDLVAESGSVVNQYFERGVVDLLISKLSDSNEAVVDEILFTLSGILNKIEESKNETLYMVFYGKLDKFVNSISKNVAKAKNINSLNNFLKFVALLINIADKRFTSEHIISILDAVDTFKSTSPNFQLDNELIDVYTTIFQKHNLIGIESKVDSIASNLLIGVSNNVRNSSLAALDASIHLVDNLSVHHINWKQFSGVEKIVNVAIEKASSKNYDSELREKSTEFLIRVFACLQLGQTEILRVIKDNLMYDLLSESTLKQVSKIFKGPNDIPTDWLRDLIDILLHFIEASNLRTQGGVIADSLDVLLSIVENQQLDRDTFVKTIESLINKTFELSKQDQTKLLIIGVSLSHLTQVNISLVEQIVELIQTGITKKSLADNSYSLLYITKNLTHKVDAENLYNELFDAHQYENPLMAEVLGTVAVEGHLHSRVVQAEKLLFNKVEDVKQLTFVLNFLGNVSKFTKLDVELSNFLELLPQYDETIQTCIAQNVGKFISRDINTYLPHILKTLKSSKSDDETSKTLRYSLLLAIKQELDIKYNKLLELSYGIERPTLESSALISDQNALNIWKVIFEIESKESDQLLINELSIASESLALIILTNKSFITHLDTYLERHQWPNALNYLVINAIKQLINQEFFNTTESRKFFLQPKFVEFIKYNLNLDMIALKQISLNLILSIFHTSFEDLFTANLVQHEILPIILVELKPRQEFIRKLQIGPFKHKIDDGVELRKTAYEILFTMLSNENIVNDTGSDSTKNILADILNRIVDFGLKDTSEIILITNLMIQKIVKLRNLAIFQSSELLDLFISRNSKIFNKKLSDKATKQQIEEQKENIKSSSKSVSKINRIVQSREGELDPENVRKWRSFFRDNLHALGLDQE